MSQPKPEGPASRAVSATFAMAIVAGTALLFYIDINTPRGVIDGIGYAGIAALCTRFGIRALLGYAAATTFLIATAPFFMPNEGIGWTAEMANRFFALLSLWTVSVVISNRLHLARAVAASDALLAEQQEAHRDLVRNSMVPGISFSEQLRNVTEAAARIMHAQRVAIFSFDQNNGVGRCQDFYKWPEHQHGLLPDIELNRSEEFNDMIVANQVVATTDIRSPQISLRNRATLEKLDVRALISAGVFLQRRLVGILAIGQTSEPREWTDRELAFARNLANVVALMFSADGYENIVAALDMVDAGLYATAPQGSLTYANRTASEMARLAAGLPAAARPIPLSAFPRPNEPLTQNSDFHEVTVGGRDMEVRRSRLTEGGIVTSVTDVTERNAARREREMLQARLTQSEKMQAIGQLAGGIAHDFNNILAPVMGFAGFLQSDLPEGSEQRGFADRIQAACQRGKDLVNQILDFTRARTVERSLVDVRVVVEQSAELVAPSIPLTTRFTSETNDAAAFVVGNPAQLSQLIVNLCANARDSIDGAGGAVALTLRKVAHAEIVGLVRKSSSTNELTIGDPDPARDYLCIAVSDTGAGIQPDVLKHIFEPFFTTKSRHRGTGLGLAVVQGVAVSHDGFCHVVSKPLELTTFSVFLPLAEAIEPAMNSAIAQGDIPAGSERVLVVDDQPDIVDMLTVGLARMGYDVVGVESPIAALEAIEENPAAWDVVVTDEVMPQLKGAELIRRIKALRPQTKTVLCTGFSDGAGESVALQSGADAFLRKPVAPAEIGRCIRALVVPSAARQEVSELSG